MAVREKIFGVERARVPILGVRALGLYQEGTSWCPAIQVALHLVLVCATHPKNTWLEGRFLRYLFPTLSWVRVPDSGPEAGIQVLSVLRSVWRGTIRSHCLPLRWAPIAVVRHVSLCWVYIAVQQCGTESVPASPARSWGMYLKLLL